ncbi:MAG: hypothetical protein JO139_18430, partial [Alphaproteobacteria bacterium]|nr:hypothetical protein [Alphaproteobacteria bacterium]
MLISQYLAPGGYVVSLQNCMNEETIAVVVGWGKVVGCIASYISVGLVEPGHIRQGHRQFVGRALDKAGDEFNGKRGFRLHRAPGVHITQNEAIRISRCGFGSEAIRVGQALGYKLQEIDHLPPETIARAGRATSKLWRATTRS